MKILIVDGSGDDRERTGRRIRQACPEAELVEVAAPAALAPALERADLDLAVVEYGLGDVPGAALIRLIQARRPAVPLLIVAGAVAEDAATAALAGGVADVVLKQQLYRLPAALAAVLPPAPPAPAPPWPAEIGLLRQVLQDEEHFRLLFEAAPIGIALARAGVTVAVNPAYLRMFGYRGADEVLGQSLLNDIAPQARAEIARRIHMREQGAAVPSAYETLGQRQDGAQFPFAVEVARVVLWDGPVSVAFCTDITARRQAEDRLRFLTEASALLGASLDYEDTLARVAQLCVPTLGDYSNVDMLADDGSLQRVAVAHADPAKVALVREGQRRYPPDRARDHPTLRVLRSGRPELLSDIGDELLERLAQDAGHLAILRALAFRSVLYVPLVVRGRVIGALSFAMAESGRRYTPEDVAFAEEVARRAAAAIDNARLYRLAREQRERLGVTLASIGDGVIATDGAGRVTLLNRVAEALTGWPAAEAVGRPLAEVFALLDEASGAPADSPVERVLREGGALAKAGGTLLVARDGRRVPIDESGAPIRADDGQVIGVVLVFQDVGARRQAEAALREQEALFRTMADSAPVLIWVSDTTGGCTFFNQPWLRYTGRTLAQEYGDGWAEGVHPDDYDRCIQIYREAFAARQPFSMDYRLRRADGVYRWLLDTGQPRFAPDGSFAGFTGSCVDITERKEAEVRERAARQEAEEASRLKDEFLATVSHELRTPLTPILGYAQLLRARQRDPAYVARTAEKIERSAHSQAQLIDDLLDVSRIVTGKLRIDPRPMDLSAVIQAALEAVRPAVDAKRIRLAVALDPRAGRIVGDPDRLQQVLWNLLSNAVKFTPPGGEVRVELGAVADAARVVVSDTGQGIAPAFMPHVFERFRQADGASTRRTGGLGLGLAIVRHLVEMHGGAVWAESPGLGHGATFTVELPLRRDSARPAAPGPEPEPPPLDDWPDLAGLRVLVVDDQPDILDFVRDTLALGGATVRACTGASEALEVLRAWRPDVLVSDIAMPDEDGYWLISAVRDLAPEDGGGTPAVALTAYVRGEDRLRVLGAGFQQYVPKPVEPVELVGVVASLAAGRP